MAYKDVIIPENKDPKTYKFAERRAEIFRLILQAGHPDLISQTQLAKRYGKSQGQISQDVSAIKKEILENLGSDAEVITRVVFEKSVKELLKQGKYRDAFAVVKDFGSWLFDVGVRVKAAERHEVVGRVTYD